MNDSRIINPDKIIKLLKQKINEKHFKMSYTICTIPEENNHNRKHHVYFFDVYPWGLFTSYCFEYDDSELKIKEMNKILKRKNDGKGTTTEELIADKIYSEFMAKWIAYAKVSKSSEEKVEE